MAISKALPGIEAIDRAIRERAVEVFAQTEGKDYSSWNRKAISNARYDREGFQRIEYGSGPYVCPLGFLLCEQRALRDKPVLQKEISDLAQPYAGQAFKRITGSSRITPENMPAYNRYRNFVDRFDHNKMEIDELRVAFGVDTFS